MWDRKGGITEGEKNIMLPAFIFLRIELLQMKLLVHHPDLYILVLEKTEGCFFKDALIFWVECMKITTICP